MLSNFRIFTISFVFIFSCKQTQDDSSRQTVQSESQLGAEATVKSRFLDDFKSRPEVPFSETIVKKISRPAIDKGEVFVQDPVIGPRFVESAMKRLRDNGRPGDLAYKIEMEYGLNEYTNSFYTGDKGSYGEVDSHKFGTSPNCFVCHSGRVGKMFVPGRGNPRVDLRKFFADILSGSTGDTFVATYETFRNTLSIFYDKQEKTVTPLSRLPLLYDMYKFVAKASNQTMTAGTSDPWGFAVQLFKWRNDDMSYKTDALNGRGFELQPVVLDPMPWWNLRYKSSINYDGIIRKHPRTVVQASFSPGKTGTEIRAMDSYYAEIFNAMDAYTPPKFPGLASLDVARVVTGEHLFNKSCAACHGTYSIDGRYLRESIEFKKSYNDLAGITPLSEIGTDGRRIKTLNFSYIKQLEKSWLTDYRKEESRKFNYYFLKPESIATDEQKSIFYAADEIPETMIDRSRLGYISPPLWGLWASAPYFHNGSVPTLKQFLFPESRKNFWSLKTTAEREVPYDFDVEIGLSFDELNHSDPSNRLLYDTTLDDGRSNKGHEKQLIPLSTEDRLNIFEYLKTL